MILLRILLIALLVYYGMRLLARMALRVTGGRPRGKGTDGSGRDAEERYRGLTNQVVDDADYEEIDGGDER